MTEVVAGGVRYSIRAVEREGAWLAHAERADSGVRFGVEATAATELAAIEQIASWLLWQAEHAAAFEALQLAERDYHRTLAGSAFVSPVEGPSALERQNESLEKVEAARVRLDDVRARQPA